MSGKLTPSQKEMKSIPSGFDLIAEGASGTGPYYTIKVWGAAFPDDATSFKLNGVGINLSSLNADWVDGDTLLGNFTLVSNPTSSGMKLLAYK
jgi:hypothetical protein